MNFRLAEAQTANYGVAPNPAMPHLDGRSYAPVPVLFRKGKG